MLESPRFKHLVVYISVCLMFFSPHFNNLASPECIWESPWQIFERKSYFPFKILLLSELPTVNSKSCAAMARTIQSTRPSCDICQYYFSPLDNDGVLWECRKCCKEKIKSGGWTYLHSHLKSCVGKDYRNQYKVVVLSRNAAQNKEQKAMNTGGRGKGRAAFSFDSYVLRVSEAEQEMTGWRTNLSLWLIVL